MSLENIDYGSLASSEVINNNFEYLDERITDTANKIYSNNANLESKIANNKLAVDNTISDLKTKITESDKGIANTFSENGLYITTYINGNTWYKEYFSDKEKTTRVWLEQGGYVNFGNTQFATRTITFPIAFTAICNAMGILHGPGGADDSNQGVAGWSNTTLTYGHRGWGSGVVWRAVGK